MKDEHITRVKLKAAKAGRTDWDALDRNTETELRDAALADPDNPPLSGSEIARLRRVADARRIRFNLGMTQEEFAQTFQLALSTLRDWEQGRTKPDQAARTLLRLIDKNPDEVRRMLA